jgi:hypothetical protein
MHTRPRRIQPQPRRRQRRQTIQHIKRINGKLLLVPADPARPSLVDALRLAGARIEGFFREHGVFLDVVADEEDGREGVGELQDAEGADEGGEVGDLRDGGGDDPGEDPVDGDWGGLVREGRGGGGGRTEGDPDELSHLFI